MANFGYKSRDRQGNLVSGQLEGNDSSHVAGILLGRGLTPIEVTEISTNENAFELSQLFEKPVTLDELVIFSRQMYSLMQAGIPVMRAIVMTMMMMAMLMILMMVKMLMAMTMPVAIMMMPMVMPMPMVMATAIFPMATVWL